jgi:hypothetical protein
MLCLRFAAAAVIGFVSFAAIHPANALSMADCSTKYKAAQSAGTLNGLNWNAFRKAECGASASSASVAADANSDPTVASTENAPEPAAPTVAAPKNVVFPRAVAAQYASQTPGKARLHTCLDQYHADKDKNALGGLKWIQKGGGFYSMCNAKLKG